MLSRGLVLVAYGMTAGMAAVQAESPDAVAPPPPQYRVDPYWPKPLPNGWIMGQVGGVTVDAQDHIWVLHRPRSLSSDELGAAQSPPRSECCANPPALLEFDTAGNLLKSWGGPGYVPDWPTNEHALWVDRDGNVWISGNGVDDRQVIKFTGDGRQLLEIGAKSRAPKNNQDTGLLGRAAGIEVDDGAHEVYIADGYLNNRIVVYDSDNGHFKRGWGAYGRPLSDVANTVEQNDEVPAAGRIAPYAPGDPPDKQFRSPVHCVRLSIDGLVYVCDRHNDRIQVFTKQGRFLREIMLRQATLGNGSTWSVAFSHDPAQTYLLVVDGENNVVWILRRADGSMVSSFGHSGRNAGQFHWVHQLAMDSRGDVYTGEVETGKRMQKFTLAK